MRKLLSFALILLAINGWGTGFSLTQHLLVYSHPSSTIAQTVTSTAGRGYIVVVRGNGFQASPTLTSTIDTPVLAINYQGTTGIAQCITVWYVLSSAGGANTLTATLTGVPDLSITFIECTGLTAFDGVKAATIAATPSWTTNVTTGNDVLFSFWLNENAGICNAAYYNKSGAGTINVPATPISYNNGQSSMDFMWNNSCQGLASGTYTNFVQPNVNSANAIVTAAFTVNAGGNQTLYVSQYGAGLTNGSSIGNAWAETNLNDAAFWPGAGSTIYLEGVFTNELVVQGSGIVGSPVQFIFDTGCVFESGAWLADQVGSTYGGAIYPNGSQYILIDGKSQGIIRCTNNGTGLGSYASSPDLVPLCSAISGVASNWTVQNLIITNIYNRQSITDYVGRASGVFLWGENLMVSNCVISDASGLIALQPLNQSNNLQKNYYFISNKLFNANHFINITLPENTQMTNIWILGNFYDHADRWDGRINASSVNGGDGGPRYHQDYNYMADDQTHYYTNGWVDHLHIVGNVWGANISSNIATYATANNYALDTSAGTPVWTNKFTGYADVLQNSATSLNNMYLDSTADEARNVYVYNNICLKNSSNLPFWSNPISFAGTNLWVVNNTGFDVINNQTGTGRPWAGSGQSVYVYNNICFYGSGIQVGSLVGTEANPLLVQPSLASGSTCPIVTANFQNPLNMLQTVVSDYNVCPNVTVQGFTVSLGTLIAAGPATSLPFNTLANWQSYNGNSCSISPLWNTTGADPHSTANTITWGGGYAPSTSDTTAKGEALNLTSQATAQGELGMMYDYNGVKRPSSGSWDAGAFIISGSVSPVTPSFNLNPNSVVSKTNTTQVYIWGATAGADSSTLYYQLQYTPSGTVILPWSTATSWSTNSPVVVSNQFVAVVTNDASAYVTSSVAYFDFTNGIAVSFPVVGSLPIQNQR